MKPTRSLAHVSALSHADGFHTRFTQRSEVLIPAGCVSGASHGPIPDSPGSRTGDGDQHRRCVHGLQRTLLSRPERSPDAIRIPSSSSIRNRRSNARSCAYRSRRLVYASASGCHSSMKACLGSDTVSGMDCPMRLSRSFARERSSTVRDRSTSSRRIESAPMVTSPCPPV